MKIKEVEEARLKLAEGYGALALANQSLATLLGTEGPRAASLLSEEAVKVAKDQLREAADTLRLANLRLSKLT